MEREEGEKLPNATMVGWFNDALRNQAEAFQARHGHKEGVEVMIYDSTTFLNHVLDVPEEFGIKNTTDYCRAYDQPYVDTDPEQYGCQPLDEFLYVLFFFPDLPFPFHPRNPIKIINLI